MPTPARGILAPRQFSYQPVSASPLKKKDARHCTYSSVADDHDKENDVPPLTCSTTKQGRRKAITIFTNGQKKGSKNCRRDVDCEIPCKRALKPVKPTSLQRCMQMSEHEFSKASLLGDPLMMSDSMNAWNYSGSEAAPASSWSTLPNRSLLCRPLPLDIGHCTCMIVKEPSSALGGASVYSLYTNEGQGRQSRKLAVAQHRRRAGRSEFAIAQNSKAILCSSDEGFLGTMTANLTGSKYNIWDQGITLDPQKTKTKRLLAVVAFVPTVITWTGSFRSMRVWIPKTQSMLLKSTGAQIRHVGGLPVDWQDKISKTDQLFSKIPYYNQSSKRYELDFRERTKDGLQIRPSVKNFQLTMEENGEQCILLLARVGKSKYVIDYGYPLTGYQAFAICLASIDSKLCCTI
ncbi:Tubby-like protein 4 [Nymphaea thermarum]|nr:Tubby-like protein 4 [Nymphaea thermarum]